MNGFSQVGHVCRLEGITGFLLEVLPDPSAPMYGPGRSKEGNFILSEVALKYTDPAKPAIPVTRLPNVETVHALTIHKSQGSEYDHVIVVLPDRESRILTRELLYTGVTRAKQRLTIIGSREAIARAVAKPIRRATGLGSRV